MLPLKGFAFSSSPTFPKLCWREAGDCSQAGGSGLQLKSACGAPQAAGLTLGKLGPPGVPQIPLMDWGNPFWGYWCQGISPDAPQAVHEGCLCPGPSVLPRCSEEVKAPGEEVSKAKVHYNVEFTFDTDARVAITIYYQASEEFHNGVAR